MKTNLILETQNKGIFWEAKTRILAWYIVVISSFLVMAMPLITRLTLAQVNVRVREDLQEELEVFNEFKADEKYSLDQPENANLTELFNDFLLGYKEKDSCRELFSAAWVNV